MKIDYNTLTAEQLEECVEFIEWEKVPEHLLTDKVISEFGYLILERKELLWRAGWLDWLDKLELGKIEDLNLKSSILYVALLVDKYKIQIPPTLNTP